MPLLFFFNKKYLLTPTSSYLRKISPRDAQLTKGKFALQYRCL
ncbi:hypothetical protein GCWU000282_03111 [Catonella morbi ATCC 51271]|uniref:Uncharacterized protein n=1 Tax=Catonella morbi ATCC 51271 TaxID=592026 RepID=V2Y0G5_9FIRM|nr:hypothetical protein GCWU000282_03111 [Catonella morbi ATCC 51271]